MGLADHGDTALYWPGNRSNDVPGARHRDEDELGTV